MDDYRGIVSEERLHGLREAADRLQGLRVLHINATPYGGGVAEILASLVPLMRDVGLDAHWMVLEGDEGFFKITKSLHNGLQGGDVVISDVMREHYLEVNERNAEDLEDEWDVVVVHDPQPASIVTQVRRKGKWIWRAHIELTRANKDCRDFLARYLPAYDASIYSLKDYIPKGIDLRSPTVVHPSIDPLSEKNRPVPPEEVRAIADRYGIDVERPALCCVARFDPWKDPLGTIDAFRKVKWRVRGVQLLFITSMALDDPEGWEYYEKTLRKAGEDPDIFLLTNMRGVGSLEVNAFQRLSPVSILKSIREGFGLVVAEALWKRAPVVGWRAGGIPLQILDGQTGFLASDFDTFVERTVRLLGDMDLRAEMGEAGRAHVRANFLMTRHLRDYLDLFLRLTEKRPDGNPDRYDHLP